MASFTALLNKGKRRFIDKFLKSRKFGKCENCEKPALLIEYREEPDTQILLLLCEHCYTTFLNDGK